MCPDYRGQSHSEVVLYTKATSRTPESVLIIEVSLLDCIIYMYMYMYIYFHTTLYVVYMYVQVINCNAFLIIFCLSF